MIRAALVSALFLALAPAAHAQIAVKGEWISLGDVAPVTGEASTVLIGPAPPPGQKLALDPAFIVSVAKKSGVILALPLDQPIWVTRSTGNAPPAKEATVAKAANPALQIGGAPLAGGQSSGGKQGEMIILLRDVGRGQRISESDIGWSDKAGMTARNGVTDMALAVGMEAKRPLKSGQPLQTADFKQPDLIKKGQPVKLVYASRGLRLVADGLAQNDAGKGESVRVLNSYSKRTIDAVAMASGEAHVSRQ
jgi:flagellar basal body P-ring formation protein FlgA